MGICPCPVFFFSKQNRFTKSYKVMKIKAKNPNAVANSRLIVPCDGLITIDGNGCAEVSAACAEALVKGTSDWDYAEKTAEPKSEEAPAQEESEEVELNEREKFEKELEGMTVAQMKDLCREGGFDEAEWKNLKKATLAAYLLDKFDAASAQEESEEEEEAESEQESAPADTNATSAPEEESEEEELEEEEEESEEESEEEEK